MQRLHVGRARIRQRRLRAACDQWWQDVQPLLVNENVTGPKVNPFKALYWKQFGGAPASTGWPKSGPP